MRSLSSLLVLAACACAGSATHSETAKAPAAQARAQTAPPETVTAQPAPAIAPSASAPVAEPVSAPPPASAPVDATSRASEVLRPPDPATLAPQQVAVGAALVDQVEAGEIGRPELLAVLHQGVGRFLQRVHAEPHLIGGRFAGWRIVSGVAESSAQGAGLQIGDTVMRVNGQSIERPEQFKNVWDSMATESELLLLVDRGGKRSQLRYRIVDAR